MPANISISLKLVAAAAGECILRWVGIVGIPLMEIAINYRAPSQGNPHAISALSLILVLVFVSPLRAWPFYGPQATTRVETPVTEQEAAELERAFISGMEKTGDVRKVDRYLFHPAFAQPPCAFLSQDPACAQYPPDEMREFVFSSLNFAWLVLEHQLSLPIPSWRQPNGGIQGGALNIFPDEVRDLVPSLSGLQSTPASIEEFRKLKATLAEAERRLLEHRRKHDHANQPDFEKNLADMREAARRAVKGDRFTAVPDDVALPGNLLRLYIYRDVFTIAIAKYQGVPKIVWLQLVTD
jgi:hypothetical protein